MGPVKECGKRELDVVANTKEGWSDNFLPRIARKVKSTSSG